ELQARLVVEGYLAGLHRSPHHGFAVEFAQHREYAPGDDIKHIDWKVYGRTERYYLKQYEQDTNLVCWLLVDASQSMAYGSGPVRYDRHEVVVFHVLDPAEEDFPFEGATKFRGLEIPAELLTDPRGLRDGYLRELTAFRDELRRGCRGMNIDLVPLRTDQSLGL